MKKATFFYNPVAGVARERQSGLDAACATLREAGTEVELLPTESAEFTAHQVREAVQNGSDTIFACGGDGTIHDVLQGMVGMPDGVSLGVIPMGTANALAFDLGIPKDPVKAAKTALQFKPRRLTAGKIEFTTRAGKTGTRYFTIMAGAGPDGALLYSMSRDKGVKHRLGMNAYFAHAAILAASYRFAPFEVEFTDNKTGLPRREVVAQAMAVRINDFGNVLRRLAQGASLDRDDFRLALFKPPGVLTLGMHLSSTILRRNWKMPGVELLDATDVTCRQLPETIDKIHAEADGELLGTMPVRFTVVPRAFTLLMPQRGKSDGLEARS